MCIRDREVPMPGFGKWRDPADFIIRHTYDIWDDKGMGKIYDHYKHNACLLYTSSVMTMVIPLALYILFQRYIINTFAMSGIKG